MFIEFSQCIAKGIPACSTNSQTRLTYSCMFGVFKPSSSITQVGVNLVNPSVASVPFTNLMVHNTGITLSKSSYVRNAISMTGRSGHQPLGRKSRTTSEIFCAIFLSTERSRRWQSAYGISPRHQVKDKGLYSLVLTGATLFSCFEPFASNLLARYSMGLRASRRVDVSAARISRIQPTMEAGRTSR